ncbi:hypothetical protein Tco_0108830 [Tanacetum coccineum]
MRFNLWCSMLTFAITLVMCLIEDEDNCQEIAVSLYIGFRPVNTANTKAVNTVRPVNTANTKAINTVRPVNTANTKAVNTVRPVNTANIKAVNIVKSINTAALKPINSIINTNVNTARLKHTTARDRAIVRENKGKGANAVKASACWVWKAKNNSASTTFKKYSYIDAQGRSKSIKSANSRLLMCWANHNRRNTKEKGVIDNGFQAHDKK